jgi:hypothetical protein
MESDKLTESVKFLLKSVRQLSDRFIESSGNVARSFSSVEKDVADLAYRLERLEAELLNGRDRELVDTDVTRQPIALPVAPDQQKRVIPALDLPLEGILDVYRNTPVLLQPFARPCSVSGRTLSGEIPEIELEAFVQGTTWIIEIQDAEWILVPKPGMLERRTQIDSLGRFFDIEGKSAMPAELELLKAGTAITVEHGRRWYLKDKGSIGTHANPLQRSLEQRIRRLEEKMET